MGPAEPITIYGQPHNLNAFEPRVSSYRAGAGWMIHAGRSDAIAIMEYPFNTLFTAAGSPWSPFQVASSAHPAFASFSRVCPAQHARFPNLTSGVFCYWGVRASPSLIVTNQPFTPRYLPWIFHPSQQLAIPPPGRFPLTNKSSLYRDQPFPQRPTRS